MTGEQPSKDETRQDFTEAEKTHFRVKYTVDEKNPLENNTGLTHLDSYLPTSFFSISVESGPYSHNDAAARHIGKWLAEHTNLDEAPDVFEFAHGINRQLAAGVLDVSSSAKLISLDLTSRSDTDADNQLTDQYVIKKIDRKEPLLHGEQHLFFSGDATNVADSPLFEQFRNSVDLAICHGALVSDGNNFTLFEVLSLLDQDKQPDFIQQKLQKILEGVASLIKSGGAFFVSSARYAYHGAGVGIEAYQTEKAQFIRLISLAKKLGARSVECLGVSKQSFDKQVAHNLNDPLLKARRQMAVLSNMLFNPEFIKSLTTEQKARIETLVLSDEPLNEAQQQEFNTLFDEIKDLKKPWAEQEEKLQSVAQKMTGKLSDLDPNFSNELTEDQWQQALETVPDLDQIARIDAVILRF